MYGDANTSHWKTASAFLQFFDSRVAIRQAGQRIVMGHVRDLRLSFPRFGNVL